MIFLWELDQLRFVMSKDLRVIWFATNRLNEIYITVMANQNSTEYV